MKKMTSSKVMSNKKQTIILFNCDTDNMIFLIKEIP